MISLNLVARSRWVVPLVLFAALGAGGGTDRPARSPASSTTTALTVRRGAATTSRPVPPTFEQVLGIAGPTDEQMTQIRGVIAVAGGQWHDWWHEHAAELIPLGEDARAAITAKDRDRWERLRARHSALIGTAPRSESVWRDIRNALQPGQQQALDGNQGDVRGAISRRMHQFVRDNPTTAPANALSGGCHLPFYPNHN